MLSVYSMGEMGSHAFHSHNPHSAMRGVFSALWKECNIKRRDGFKGERLVVLFLFHVGVFRILRVDPSGSEFWSAPRRASNTGFRYCKSGLAQHGISVSPRPPSATCLLAFPSDPHDPPPRHLVKTYPDTRGTRTWQVFRGRVAPLSSIKSG